MGLLISDLVTCLLEKNDRESFLRDGEDGARGLKTSPKYPRFRMGSGCRIHEKRPAGGEDGEEARGDLFPCEEGLDEPMAEQLHEADRIPARNGNK